MDFVTQCAVVGTLPLFLGILLSFFGNRPDLYVTLVWASSHWSSRLLTFYALSWTIATCLSPRSSAQWVAHSCCPLAGSRAVCQKSSPGSVYGTLFICGLGNLIWTRCLLSSFALPATGSTRWRCELVQPICHLWKPEQSSNLDGPSLEGFGFCQLRLYLALAISISFSLSKAVRLIKPHKATNRKQNCRPRPENLT